MDRSPNSLKLSQMAFYFKKNNTSINHMKEGDGSTHSKALTHEET